MTTTDKLNSATTWQQVVATELHTEWIEAKSFESLEGYEDQLGLYYTPDYEEESYVRYDNLADEAEKALTDFENFVFWGIVNEDRSYRHLADEAGCSYETIRVTYRRAQKKLQEVLG